VVLTTQSVQILDVQCVFSLQGEITGRVSRDQIGGGEDPDRFQFLTVPLTIGIEIEDRPQAVGVECATSIDGVVFNISSAMTLIRVDKLTIENDPGEP
jgi:hypothetical protein